VKKPKIKRIKFEDGSSTGGFNTGDDTLVLKGKAAPGAKVKIFDNGELIGTVKANKKGKWKFETDNLDDGAHGFQIKAKGSWDGGATRSKVVSGEVDTAAPEAPGMALSVASDTGSSSSDGITADATPTLGGTAEAGVTVTIRDGATVLGTAVADAAGNVAGEALLPGGLEEALLSATPCSKAAFGRFTVCPLTPSRPGAMQTVCVSGADQIVVKDW